MCAESLVEVVNSIIVTRTQKYLEEVGTLLQWSRFKDEEELVYIR